MVGLKSKNLTLISNVFSTVLFTFGLMILQTLFRKQSRMYSMLMIHTGTGLCTYGMSKFISTANLLAQKMKKLQRNILI